MSEWAFKGKIQCQIKEDGEKIHALATVLLPAAESLLADVRRRYPGEPLRCEYMLALDAAVNEARGEA